MTFQFVKGQAPMRVPLSTTELRFEFFDGPDGTGARTQPAEVRAFAPTITITVLLSTRSVRITALSSQGEPLVLAVVNVAITPSAPLIVDFENVTIIPIPPPPVLTTLTVAPDDESLSLGGLKAFTVTGADQNGASFPLASGSVSWTASAGLEIASTSGTTVIVEGIAQGPATVTASVAGLSDSTDVNVFEPALDGIVSLSPPSVNLEINPASSVTLTTVGSFGDAPDRALTNAEDGLNYVVTGDPGVVEVESNGTVTPIAVGSTAIMASAGGFSATVPVSVVNAEGNQAPEILAESALDLIHQNSEALPVFSSVQVSDDQANLAGGTLSIEVSGSNTDVVLSLTSEATIGSVTGLGTNSLSVDLDSGATPAQIREVLLGLEIASETGADLGAGKVSVGLSDGLGGDNLDDQPEASYLVLGEGAERYIVPDEYLTIQEAVDAASANATAGAAVVVRAGTYSASVTTIANNPGLANLQVLGPNATISAGAQEPGVPRPLRGPEAILRRLDIYAPGVTLDGLTFERDIPTGSGVLIFTGANNFVLRNSILRSTVPGDGGGFNCSVPVSTPLRLEGNAFRDLRSGATAHFTSISANALDDVVIVGNIFENNEIGVTLRQTRRPIISGNSFFDNDTHLTMRQLAGFVEPGDISENDFTGTGVVALVSSAVTVFVENNWWGDALGPMGQTSPGTGTLDSDPHATSAFTNYP